MSTSEPIAGSASTTIACCSTDAQRLPGRCQGLAKGLPRAWKERGFPGIIRTTHAALE
jgi:hypothetical protein